MDRKKGIIQAEPLHVQTHSTEGRRDKSLVLDDGYAWMDLTRVQLPCGYCAIF